MSMTGDELRQAYQDFFADKGHLVLPSAPLVPENDPTLLWINAGMAPFKPYFDGRMTPPNERVVTSQKCIRTNDIENVGRTARHQTFFEMLGNFSFGNYFKKEAITWAWEFVTEVIDLPEDRLWITIYKDDDESFDIWHDIVGLKEERIIRMGKKDNFWQIGTGPCGPCSEIHYDRGEEYSNSDEDVIGGEGDRFLEIWNLVFTQYNYTEDGEYLPLPNKNIDTGMGLERVASILQEVDSNFETDLLKPMIDFVREDSGIDYKKDSETTMAYRVIADHIRSITMAIFDGVLPSNEGRGYVIRRLLRRAVRHGGKLGYTEPFLYRIVPVVNKTMAGGYPELVEKENHIISIIKAEEERFFQTLDQGLEILNGMMEDLKENDDKVLSGKDAFKLYDTYGFPLELTREVVAEKGFDIDEENFNQEMKKQRQRAREAREDIGFSGTDDEVVYKDIRKEIGKTQFLGYSSLEQKADIIAIIKDGKQVQSLHEGEKGEVVLNKTPFYAQGGGQVGDRGLLQADNNIAEVYDTSNKAELYVHSVNVKEGVIEKGETVKAVVFSQIRKATARNHSSTHLLHQALRETLGEHVNQSGSLVSPERLRFDFSHFSAMSEEELKKVERRVNEIILNNIEVDILKTNIEKAKEMGATALFGEKYGKSVRVVKMGDYSLELCAGTHVSFTGEIGLFKITSESGIAAGIRRIEAVTAFEALKYVEKEENILNEATDLMNVNNENLNDRINQLLSKQKEMEKEITSLKDKLANFESKNLLDQVEKINDVSLLTAELKDLDNEALRNLVDQLKEELDSGIIVLASNLTEKVLFVAAVTDDLVQEGYHAGKLISKLAKIAGGGGGGRPDLAQAGGRQPEKINEAFKETRNIILNK